MLTSLPRDVPKMETLDYIILMQVHEMAAGMNKDEIMEAFSMKREDLTTGEIIYFDEFYNYGRGQAVNRVIHNLLDQTKGKAGVQPALAFLRRFAREFEGEETGSADGNFSFNFTQ